MAGRVVSRFELVRCHKPLLFCRDRILPSLRYESSPADSQVSHLCHEGSAANEPKLPGDGDQSVPGALVSVTHRGRACWCQGVRARNCARRSQGTQSRLVSGGRPVATRGGCLLLAARKQNSSPCCRSGQDLYKPTLHHDRSHCSAQKPIRASRQGL